MILDAFASVLGCSVSWLACGEGEPPTKETVEAAVARARAQRDAADPRPSSTPPSSAASKAA
ncbi:MAG: hypothetical protein EPO40_19680 [Myxococcaceae bacterium]|nr:MAG: hypothetical protein EPO40_19680 [Myxococcaceae bacterium]